MQKYYENQANGIDLGSWKSFVKELSAPYGQRDSEEAAKEELTALWANQSLAKSNFLKYAEQYRTLGRMVKYEDKIHMFNLKSVIPQELRSALVVMELAGEFKDYEWEKYLDVLLKVYKNLHPEKVKGTIFGSGGIGNTSSNSSSSSKKDPNAMDVDTLAKSKAKGKGHQANSSETSKARYCQICAGKGLKAKSRTHNTVNCYDKPGNEGKRPAPRTSTPSAVAFSGNGQGSGTRTPVKKTWKARLMEILAEDSDDEDGTTTPVGTININTASITGMDDPEPAAKGATAHIDEEQSEPSTSKRGFRRNLVDFPKGL